MNQNKLTFNIENLNINWVGFNIESQINLEPIANCLFKLLQFNLTIIKKINGKWKSKSSNSARQKQFKVFLKQHEYNPETKSSWVGTKIDFSGKNDIQIYKAMRAQKFDWNILKLKNASLGRIYIYYFRQSEVTDQEYQIEHFMEKSYHRIRDKSKRKKAHWNRELNALVLRIDNRSSFNYYRVYQKHNGLQFELELKN